LDATAASDTENPRLCKQTINFLSGLIDEKILERDGGR
jgi:hypothetical protein